ncbi:hypothetical protein P7C70_g7982, partial [Phenoliferia sp. Uapishka_3]
MDGAQAAPAIPPIDMNDPEAVRLAYEAQQVRLQTLEREAAEDRLRATADANRRALDLAATQAAAQILADKADSHTTRIRFKFRDDCEVKPTTERPIQPEILGHFTGSATNLQSDIWNILAAFGIIAPLLFFTPDACQDTDLTISRPEFGTTKKEFTKTWTDLKPWYRKDFLIPFGAFVPAVYLLTATIRSVCDNDVVAQKVMKLLGSILVRYSVRSWPALRHCFLSTIRRVSVQIMNRKPTGDFHIWNKDRMHISEAVYNQSADTWLRNANPSSTAFWPHIIGVNLSDAMFNEAHLLDCHIADGKRAYGVVSPLLRITNDPLPSCGTFPTLPLAGRLANADGGFRNGGGSGGNNNGGGNNNNNGQGQGQNFGGGGGQSSSGGQSGHGRGQQNLNAGSGNNGGAGGNGGADFNGQRRAPPPPRPNQFCPPCGTVPNPSHYWKECPNVNNTIEKRPDQNGFDAMFSRLQINGQPNRFPLCMSANWTSDAICKDAKAGKVCYRDHDHCALCGSLDHKALRCPNRR